MPALCVLAVALVVLVVHLRLVQFFCDDSYISYRYALNLVEGQGLVYNPGERVEGYTNFLWVLVLAAGMAVGLPAEGWSLAAGLIFLGATLALTWVLVLRVLRSPLAAAVAVLLLVSLGPVVLWSSAGLESSLFTALSLAAILATHSARNARGLWLAGATFALAAMTRPDGVVFGAVAGLHLIVSDVAARRGLNVATVRALSLLSGFLLVFAPFVGWRYSYYHDFLPNTFYVKAVSSVGWVLGRRYLDAFVHDYPVLWLITAAGAYCALALDRYRAARPLTTHLLLAIGAFTVYVAWAGGDYMALYRFLVPVLVLASVFWVIAIDATYHFIVLHHMRLPTCLGMLLFVLGSSYQPSRDSAAGKPSILHSVSNMRRNTEAWVAAGKALYRLGEKHPRFRDCSVATTAAGALPFFSRMPTLDQSGLCDRTIAREESDPWLLDRPGHFKQATLEYLTRRRPTLVVWHPTVRPKGFPFRPLPPTDCYVPRMLPVPDLPDEGGNPQYLYFFLDREWAAAGVRAGMEQPFGTTP